jgi:hypothetical protein
MTHGTDDLILSLSKDEAARSCGPHGSSLDKLGMRKLTMRNIARNLKEPHPEPVEG